MEIIIDNAYEYETKLGRKCIKLETDAGVNYARMSNM
jgi:hypothetical protein